MNYIIAAFAILALLYFIFIVYASMSKTIEEYSKEIEKTILANDRLTIFYTDGTKSVFVKNAGHWYIQKENKTTPHDNFIECSAVWNDYVIGVVRDIEFERLENN